MLIAEDYTPNSSIPESFVQPKYNGVRATWQEGRLWSRDLKEIKGLPHINKALEGLDMLDGELWCDGMHLQDINGICTPVRETPHEDAHKIHFQVFDTITRQCGAWERIIDLLWFGDEGPIRCTPSTFVGCDTAKIEQLYQETIPRWPYIEGIVVRYANSMYVSGYSRSIFKYKQIKEGEGDVIEILDAKGKHANSLGKVKVFWRGIILTLGRGTIDEAEADKWWAVRNDGLRIKARFDYAELSKDGQPLRPILTCLRIA